MDNGNIKVFRQAHYKKDEDLSPELRRVAREGGTEAPFSGAYWDNHKKGMYRCAVCGTELFSSDTKFDSGTGWPSFTDPSNREHIVLKEDTSGGIIRTEVLCKTCGAHLGHVFEDLPRFVGKAGGPKEKGGKRYCINSVCLAFEEKK